MSAVYRHVKGFLSEDDRAELETAIRAESARMFDSRPPLGLGPRYRTLTGEDIRDRLPTLARFGAERVRALAEEFAGRPLRVPPNPGRAVRVQIFDRPDHRFNWHYDSSAVDCLITLRNDNASETQFLSRRLSRALRPLYLPLYGARRLLSVLPHQRVRAEAGDLLMLQGSDVLHRGLPTAARGERLLLVFAYEELNQPERPWRDRVVKHLNTGYARR